MAKPTLKDEHPAWFKQLLQMPDAARTAAGITDEYLEEAEKGWLREADYTKKTQEVAEVRKFMEANPGMNLEEAKRALDWAKTQWPIWEKSYKELEARANARPAAEPASDRRPAAGGRKWRDATVEDLYETDRLRAVFLDLADDLQTSIVETATKKLREDWYQKEEVPRLDKMALGYSGTLINLLKNIWPADKPSIEQILKESAVRGEPDLTKVFNDLVTSSTKATEGGFNDGFKKGQEELEAKWKKEHPDWFPASGTPAARPAATGPLNGTTPAWKPPAPGAKPLSYAERAAAVLTKVEEKHGPLPR